MIDNLKQTIESLLFSTGKKFEVKELARLCRTRDLEKVDQSLKELKKEHEEKNSSLIILQEGDLWRMTVKDQYLPFIRKIVTQTELTKSIMETLAIIAYKAPILQNQIIKIRTNKAYNHLSELEKTGFITREKKGRTKLIKIAEKFYTYFDISKEKLKEAFINPQQLAKEVDHLETLKESSEKLEKKQTPEIDLITDGKKTKLEIYHQEGQELDHLGILQQEETPKSTGQIITTKGMFSEGISKEVEKKIEEKVKEILSTTEKENNNTETENEENKNKN